MVREVELTYYKCPYCKERYKTLQEAEDCATFCVEPDDPITETESTIYCEMCNKIYPNREKAESCEDKHKESNDWRYEEYLRQQSLIKLDLAQKHPAQSRITAFAKVT